MTKAVQSTQSPYLFLLLSVTSRSAPGPLILKHSMCSVLLSLHCACTFTVAVTSIVRPNVPSAETPHQCLHAANKPQQQTKPGDAMVAGKMRIKVNDDCVTA